VSPGVAVIVRRSRPEIPVCALLDWHEGIWIGESDAEILRAASAQALTLVTYDQRTIPPAPPTLGGIKGKPWWNSIRGRAHNRSTGLA
jgi:hypothetical protein